MQSYTLKRKLNLKTVQKYKVLKATGNLHYRLNIDLDKTKEILHHCSKKPVKISKIATFGYKMFQNEKKIASRSLKICV